MKTKTLARIASIQAIYQYIICDTIPIEKIIDNTIKYHSDDKKKNDKYSQININFFSEFIKFTTNDLNNLDQIIKENLASNWSIASIHLTLLCLLRCSIAELIFFPETPTKVIISEYTNISTMMLSVGEESFVNGILENIAKKVRVKNL